jgi:hypothetical protein
MRKMWFALALGFIAAGLSLYFEYTSDKGKNASPKE